MDIKAILFYIISPIIMAIGGIGVNAVRSLMNRVVEIEKALPHKMEEIEVRQLLDDKIDPLKDDIKDIKATISAIHQILINK